MRYRIMFMRPFLRFKVSVKYSPPTSFIQTMRESINRGGFSYLWLYRTGRSSQPIIIYDYQPTRAGENPRKFLSDFQGYLHVDGYAGYRKIPGVTLVGCWAHARRKFDEALKVVPVSLRSTEVTAKEGLAFCNRLFAVERSRPILDECSAWLQRQKSRVLPKSALGQAITYRCNQWEPLQEFLKDGRLEIDNNRSERSIKPFVIGRTSFAVLPYKY